MAAELIVQPVYRVTCDHPGGCKRYQDANTEWLARAKAEVDGWQTRPWRGKGSRSAPDLCPEHASAAHPKGDA